MWKQWVNALLGLAIIAVAFMGLPVGLAWTLGIIGAGVLALSLWTVGEVPKGEYDRVVQHRHA